MSKQTTAGVQELIDRLSQEGVAQGQRQAEQIVGDAQRQADEILASARQQANEIRQQAQQEAAQFQTAGEEALRLAARDAVRDFGARIHNGFRARLQALVHHEVKDPDLVRRMILQITQQAIAGAEGDAVEILLPSNVLTEAEARELSEAGEQDTLSEFVEGLIGGSLRKGFTMSLGSPEQRGVVVRFVNEKVEIDLTEEAIAELLALHLLPRFRAIMRGA